MRVRPGIRGLWVGVSGVSSGSSSVGGKMAEPMTMGATVEMRTQFCRLWRGRNPLPPLSADGLISSRES